ncbi:hypothetical protein Y032_0555g3374 [Ancylostoma ceylanicum]|uniref:Uncharacterized protein n=1 Tax=Ancylostoma ceylanicum TaxID=53326 RepID=A0A016WRZ8_9BILA|nr:hypothetical protein Y032_0555g3374 [Ancylostoma ceylanicum]
MLSLIKLSQSTSTVLPLWHYESPVSLASSLSTASHRTIPLATGLDTRSAPYRRQRIGDVADNPGGMAVDGWTASADWRHHQDGGIIEPWASSGAELSELSEEAKVKPKRTSARYLCRLGR